MRLRCSKGALVIGLLCFFRSQASMALRSYWKERTATKYQDGTLPWRKATSETVNRVKGTIRHVAGAYSVPIGRDYRIPHHLLESPAKVTQNNQTRRQVAAASVWVSVYLCVKLPLFECECKYTFECVCVCACAFVSFFWELVADVGPKGAETPLVLPLHWNQLPE
jgi:hypothetical protein